MPYALDNGAWAARDNPASWDEAAFVRMMDRLGAGADWVVVPDVVGDWAATKAKAAEWIPRLTGKAPILLIAVQDGATPDEVRPLLSKGVGIFLGGTTDRNGGGWKISTMGMWGRLAWEVGCYFHVGRVNSAKRIALAKACGADSFDGNSPTMFPCTLPDLDRARAVVPPQVQLWSKHDR